jgi:hypothetical protein
VLKSRWVLWRRMFYTMVGTMLVTAAPALAAEPPKVLHIPDVSGTAQAGQQLRAVDADWRGDEPMSVAWTWLRCTTRDVRDCRAISGTNSVTYRAAAADVGKRLRVLLMLSNEQGSAWAISPDTNVVASAPSQPPAVTPTPTPVPPVASPLPGPGAGPVTPPAASPSPSSPSPAAKPTMMKPFPVIRISGSLTRVGAKVSLLTVKAPKGAAISLRCFGRSCPANKWAHTASMTRIFAFQRRMRAGTKIVITVTKRNRIGKHTTFVIRKGKPPKRIDRCLYPGVKRPAACGAT